MRGSCTLYPLIYNIILLLTTRGLFPVESLQSKPNMAVKFLKVSGDRRDPHVLPPQPSNALGTSAWQLYSNLDRALLRSIQ